MKFEAIDTTIPTLGPLRVPSPIKRGEKNTLRRSFVNDTDKVVLDVNVNNIMKMVADGKELPAFELAGPREKLYFDPSKLRCGLVTCGGLCPGLNDIIRAIVLELFYGYGVKNIFGFKYGLQGFIPKYMHEIMDLKPETVVNIHEMGGSILGSSRGPQPIDEIVDSLERMNIGILFMIGGDGTLVAATRITDAITERNLKISVVGIPKTIDNDIHLVSRSFGFDTAVDVATQAIRSAHNEAAAYPNGIGLIKLMGRNSGFIAATAALAQQDVNFVLVPEVDFDLEGPNGLFANLEKRLDQRGHAVIVVAEGAGQKFFENNTTQRDESGNIRLKDIGFFLKDAIVSYFHAKGIDVSLKYIDPSYMIRSLPANANDNVFCSFLGRDAVHAGMAGKTKLLVGSWNNHFVHIPMSASAGKRKKMGSKGKLWLSVLGSTGQGSLKND
ncbi:MAG: diphosphate--fructose-6-phosphate 1-phosphotransferase [Desulfobacteraceae bacterium]|nr:ATP-dependent 6-phosphofructokinase [Desulfobacteraceae bacterium]MDH3721675.1 ATP-dependent 6-phosphofructokinase [Desulfobacteraceae bacterium]MDH3875067.1 ATP-dependent 6-phosphofructokinase [Desulfobacteraceae bacterium]PLX53322.1 MAG: diphosphate--fructose-6-phosphate 1-phosphotransferase [Desulfobacteraceae bacterium]